MFKYTDLLDPYHILLYLIFTTYTDLIIIPNIQSSYNAGKLTVRNCIHLLIVGIFISMLPVVWIYTICLTYVLEYFRCLDFLNFN